MNSSLLFLGGTGLQELVILIIAVLICIGIFLVLRAVVLWYWKIDRIVTNQEIQNRLLQEIVQSINKQKNSNGTQGVS